MSRLQISVIFFVIAIVVMVFKIYAVKNKKSFNTSLPQSDVSSASFSANTSSSIVLPLELDNLNKNSLQKRKNFVSSF